MTPRTWPPRPIFFWVLLLSEFTLLLTFGFSGVGAQAQKIPLQVSEISTEPASASGSTSPADRNPASLVGASIPSATIKSPYTDFLVALEKNWPPKNRLAANPDLPLTLRAQTQVENPLYIGAEQAMIIQAPLKSVQEILDNFSDYKNLFVDIKNVDVIAKKENNVFVRWTQVIHLPFFPDSTYDMLYSIKTSKPNRRSYLYGLVRGDDLNFSDGLIVLESVSATQTHYYEIDFFDAKLGLARHLPSSRIWREALTALVHSDLAIKIKAEDPTLSSQQAKQRASKTVDAINLRVIYDNRSVFSADDFLADSKK